MATGERWGPERRRKRRRRDEEEEEEAVSAAVCCCVVGRSTKRRHLSLLEAAKHTRLMDLRGNHQWLMRSKLFNCTNAALSSRR